jgi:hypothetical protein
MQKCSFFHRRPALTATAGLPGCECRCFKAHPTHPSGLDAAGWRTHANELDVEMDWHLESSGKVTKVIDNTLSKTIVYAYGDAGRRTSLDGPEASDTQAWSFDAVGRLTKITENSNDRGAWLYNVAGDQTKLTYGSGSYGTWEYDASGRLTNLVHKKSGGTVIQSFALQLHLQSHQARLQRRDEQHDKHVLLQRLRPAYTRHHRRDDQ